ncbi:hypothetical protein ACFQ34_12575 [Pseudonocardia benzenivorans]|jgi:hypothetical protein|uniref:Uncharacterized protein n=2 Tax=Pseudonocardia TaxID=1847 RepID=F4CUF9_PSEUX|nr:hypothetical protein [Pseudonocardia dioxanivorans]AEA25349.1 hypothetical protein Psed_3153 [Pseudonocardia dioxanivorans CB1190]GJF02315.1 hypothetical protein PSD17_12780 [Pseudonocardia sp. D17]
MHATPPDPDAPTPDDERAARLRRVARLRTMRTCTPLVLLVVLVVGAGLVFFLNYPFFGVVLVVLAVFAAVDLTWSLRRNAGPR